MGDFRVQPLRCGQLKDHLRCIFGKSEPLLNKLRGSALDGSDVFEIGSTVRRNLDDGTT